MDEERWGDGSGIKFWGRTEWTCNGVGDKTEELKYELGNVREEVGRQQHSPESFWISSGVVGGRILEVTTE